MQSLNSNIIEEMALYFTTTALPTLVSEIIADLKRPAKSDVRIPEDVVKRLAGKMIDA